MNFEDISDKLDKMMYEIINDDSFTHVTQEMRSKVRLDPRAIPFNMWVSEESLIVGKNDVRILDYYGGFEYVDKEHRFDAGLYVVFSNEGKRVKEVIDQLLDLVEEDEE